MIHDQEVHKNFEYAKIVKFIILLFLAKNQFDITSYNLKLRLW